MDKSPRRTPHDAIEFAGIVFIIAFFAAMMFAAATETGPVLPITLIAMTLGAASVLGIVRWVNHHRTKRPPDPP